MMQYFQKSFTIRSATSDRHPEFVLSCVFASSQTQPTERDGEVVTEYLLERAMAHSFSTAHTAHYVAQVRVVSASFMVIPHAHSHFVF